MATCNVNFYSDFRKVFLIFSYLFNLFFVVNIPTCYGLYEDQIGKFDWRQQYIGKVKFVTTESPLQVPQKILIGTEKNVLAALYTKNGTVAWRKVFEKGNEGEIVALSGDRNEVIVISGNGAYVRCFDRENGLLNWETSIPNLSENSNSRLRFHINTVNQEISVVQCVYNSHISVTSFNTKTTTMQTWPQFSAPWLKEDTNCDFINSDYFACVDRQSSSIKFFPLTKDKVLTNFHLSSLGYENSDSTTKVLSIIPIQNTLFALKEGIDTYKFVNFETTSLKVLKTFTKVIKVSTAVIDGTETIAILQQVDATSTNQEKVFTIKVYDLKTWQDLEHLDGKVSIVNLFGNIEKFFLQPYSRKEKSQSYKLMIATTDHKVYFFSQDGRELWTREESLASILNADLVDLPLSDTEAKIEQEFKAHDSNIVNLFMTRLTTQITQLQAFMIKTIQTLQSMKSFRESKAVTRDIFGLHKVIVVATEPGKIFGLDNLSGNVVWSSYVADLTPFEKGKDLTYLLFLQRGTAHIPYPALCTVVGKHKVTGLGYLHSFDPINGNVLKSEMLQFKVQQASSVGIMDKKYIKGILLLDSNHNVHIYPESSKYVIQKHKNFNYIVTIDSKENVLVGYNVAISPKNDLSLNEVWKTILPEDNGDITDVILKRQAEHVHSQGRVMGDRSVLYKYLNPNLAVVISQGIDNQLKPFFNFYFIDMVTGFIVYSSSHKRCKGPVHIVHSENWAVYAYHNEKLRRTEFSAIEFYEGTIQSNTTAFSSLHPPNIPLVEHQTFIFPSGVEALATTLTERGITSKHILVALPSGAILELPRIFLDPRRPIHPTPDHREEGLIPYIPELPIPSDSIVNYNNSVVNVYGIHTAPSGLESTCLVFVYGLDLYYTRVTPSKTFDILKDDFDFLLISAVLLALIGFSYLTKCLASRKALQLSWK